MNTTTLALIDGERVELPTEVTTIETALGNRVLDALVVVGGRTYEVDGADGEWVDFGAGGRPSVYVIEAPGPVYDLVEMFDWAASGCPAVGAGG